MTPFKACIPVLLLTMVSLSHPFPLSAQRSLLSGFDPGQPGSVIVTISSHGDWSADPNGQVVVSYFDGAEEMRQIRDYLVMDAPATVYPFGCFESWELVAAVAGRPQKMLVVSENCHQIRIESTGEAEWNGYDSAFAFLGYFPFKGYKIGKRRMETFPDRATATAAWNKMLAEPNLLFVANPIWERWDGTCEFRREHITLADSAAMKDTRSKIAAQFPGIPFDLDMQLTGANWKDDYSYMFTLHCPAELGSKFKIWSTNWRPYDFKLESFWRE